MTDFALGFCVLGLLVFLYRLKPWKGTSQFKLPAQLPFVSVIIPCRNEEKNLPLLLHSLLKLEYPHFEIIVVDDASNDRTFQLATELLNSFSNSKVLRAPEKPQNWGGKNWPCSIGARAAQGELLLFTDADTLHAPDSLRKTVGFLNSNNHDFISAVPYHQCNYWWEKCLGLFLLLPLIATAFLKPPSRSRLFAIGQYLLITKTSYWELDGHSGVATSLAEDMDLATRWLEHKKSYAVFPSAKTYSVQMYNSFRGFYTGWKRLLRLGLSRSTTASFLEVTLVCNLFCFSLLQPRAELLMVFAAALMALGWAQIKHGRFFFLGVITAPLNVLLFVLLTILAVLETLLKKDIQWHGRSYQNSSSGV